MQSKMPLLFVLLFLIGSGVNVFAVPITLVGSTVQPNYMDASPEVNLTASDLELFSDGSLSTGYSFTSSAGEYSSNPKKVAGFGMRFDFDVSGVNSLDQIYFSWTGSYIQDGINKSLKLRIGSSQDALQTKVKFDSKSFPEGEIKTGMVSYMVDGAGRQDIADILNGDIATIWVQTDPCFNAKSTQALITLRTLEVSANATAAVPEPSSLVLIGTALLALVFMRRHKVP